MIENLNSDRQANGLVINPDEPQHVNGETVERRAPVLKLFTQAETLKQIGHTRVGMFLDSFADELKEAAIELPRAEESDPGYFSAVAEMLAEAEGLPERLLRAALALEAAASPECGEALESVIQRRLPCISLNRNCKLDCALELWFAARDELAQFETACVRDGSVWTKLQKSSPSPLPVLDPYFTETSSAAPGEGNLPPTPGLNHVSSGGVLLDELAGILTRFVVLPKHAAETLALWIVHTYCFQFRDVSTYIGIESPVKRCGKTTLLSVLGKLVQNPIMASNISAPAFFRVIEEEQPTLLIDEADTFLGGNDELRGILNAGYYRPNAYVIRVTSEPLRAAGENREENGQQGLVTSSPTGNGGNEQQSLVTSAATGKEGKGKQSLVTSAATGNGGSRLARYSCWCPKGIAAIGHLPETLADRCIVIRMQRKRGDEECERLRNLDARDAKERCTQFAREHEQTIGAAKPEMPPVLNDRACDIWEPLFAIADIAGGTWPEKARAAAVAFTTGAQESNPSATLLFDIGLTFVMREAERLFTHQLLEDLNGPRFAGRAWRELLKGKPATEMWVAQQLRPFGVRPKLLRIQERVGKGYELSELQELFGRYAASELESWKAENMAKAG